MINVCIVDDEKNIREGIRMLIDWDSLGCNVVEMSASAISALKYIRENPVDIVVTDIKMPAMDGLEFSRILKEERPDIKIIILTAFSEFEMAREALRSGVSEFIVKNEFMEDLPKAIEKCVDEIKESSLSNYICDEVNSLEMALKQVINNPSSELSNIIEDSSKNYCLCPCEINAYEDGNQNTDSLLEMLGNLLKISLKNCEFVICEAGKKVAVIGISFDKDSSMDINRIIECLSNMLIMVEEFMRVQIKIGISGTFDRLNQTNDYLLKGKSALSKIDSKGCLLRLYEEDLHDKKGGLIDVDKYLDRISELTFDETRDGAGECLIDFVEELRESDCNFDQCKLYMLVVYSTLIHKAVRYQLSVELDFNEYEKEVYLKVQEANTIEELGNIGITIIGLLRDICIGKKNFRIELVEKVDLCIKDKYMEELTLQVISNEIFLNSSYVSRAYKKMTGRTVTEAITLYRVAKAKDMLKNTNLRVYEIAKNVGFKDAAYFTNVFVKYTDLSPSDYRQAK